MVQTTKGIWFYEQEIRLYREQAYKVCSQFIIQLRRSNFVLTCDTQSTPSLSFNFLFVCMLKLQLKGFFVTIISCQASEALDPLKPLLLAVRTTGCAISKGGLSLWRRGEEGICRDTEKDVKGEIVFS